ncbi:MAG: sulfate ABC transporter ATP-binding protein [Rhodospirillaceae bacterium]|nr:sulfate ABC transporter ATP-binding protein [Rhodospirillaceae bacterium]
MTITVDGISKSFNDFQALKGVELAAARGEFIALLGPSGSGKTTLLRILAGLEFADSGRLLFDGRDVAAQGAGERNVGFVFQHYALFKHMTVAENVSFGLRVKPRAQRPAKAEIDRQVNELLRLVQLDRLGGRYPSQLSGGQRQRVALARALAIQPAVLLLDEPFGALDAKVRKELRRWLRRLHDDMQLTSIFVTHDQEEALELADRIAVMREGRIEQIGTPAEIYHRPATAFVYEFLGNANRLRCRIDRGRAVVAGLELPAPEYPDLHDAAGTAFVRPHDLVIADARQSGLEARVRQVFLAGPAIRVELALLTTGDMLEAEVPHGSDLGSLIVPDKLVTLQPTKIRAFPDAA